MADAARGPVVGRPLAFANEDQRAVHSWSRISSAGHSVLLDALKILSPMSHDLSSSEELVTFLQELSEEGHTPTVLRSKDVYRYRSCTNQPLTEDMLKPANRNVRPTAKRRGRRPLAKKREVHPSWSTYESSNPRIQGVRPPELLADRRAIICSRTPSRTVEMSQALQVRPCLRLTNIEGPSGFHTARLQIHTSWDLSSVAFSQQQHPPTLSGIPLQPSQNGGGPPTKAVALFSQKSLSCPIRLDGALIGDSAPVFYANGRVFPETPTELTSNGWRSNGLHRDGRGPKELNNPTRQRNGWKDKNNFRWKVIKVDDSRSVAEARRKAQKILQVNLSPVIQIQPLNHVLRDFRYQNK
ncbi:uncharacterized protein ccdc71 [Enoplosus armatus]|uniref:uncharacterized protein ccdc71 n=1 Tax=Enoplosus armatus TaxID=215367 RepID=UPI0039948F43